MGCREVLMMGFKFTRLTAIVAAALTVGVLMSAAYARVGGGGSMGSRGSRTFSAPPPTSTAPSVAPMQRTVTQPTRPGAPNTVGAAPAGGGFFSRPGLLGGLAAGFLGAGLFGMLFGHGLFGGLGGLASFFGLILQIGLGLIIGGFLWRMWLRRIELRRIGLWRGAGWRRNAVGPDRDHAGRLRCLRAAARRHSGRL